MAVVDFHSNATLPGTRIAPSYESMFHCITVDRFMWHNQQGRHMWMQRWNNFHNDEDDWLMAAGNDGQLSLCTDDGGQHRRLIRWPTFVGTGPEPRWTCTKDRNWHPHLPAGTLRAPSTAGPGCTQGPVWPLVSRSILDEACRSENFAFFKNLQKF